MYKPLKKTSAVTIRVSLVISPQPNDHAEKDDFVPTDTGSDFLQGKDMKNIKGHEDAEEGDQMNDHPDAGS